MLNGLVGQLAALSLEQRFAPRLSISAAHRPCTPPSDCTAKPLPDQLAGLAHRVAQVVQESSDPDAIHASALIDLLYEPGVGKPLQRSISSLQMAAWLGNRPAAVLADLAAAYLIRAERAHTPRDLIAAIEVADEALEREPRNQTALYNRALALQRFGLVEEAAHGWQEYLRVDSVSGWAGEARRHRREALTIDPLPTPPGPDAPEVGYAAYAVADPQRARELGWCRVLGDWANAALTGDTERAEGHLQRAEALGRGLEQRAGGDATLAYGVRAIRGQAEGRGLRKLAQAHREFAAGCELQDRVEFRRAAPRFANAMAATDASPTLQAWARLLYGSMVFHSGDARLGETIFREVSAETDPARHPALAARARLLLAMVLLRGDRYEAVLEQAQKSHALFARAGERENEAVALDALAGTQFSLRDMDAGYALAQRALQRLQPFRDSYRLHNLLSYVAEFVAGDGFPRSAVRMQDEGVRVAERTGNPAYVVEARLTRARLLAAAGAFDRASADIATAEESLEKLGDPKVRGWMIAQRQMAAAATSLRAHPALVATALDSAATYYIEMSVPLLAFPAMVDGAWARVAAGDVSRGMTGLEAALAILERRRDSIRMESRRAAVFEAAREVVDRVAMLKLASGRTAEALEYLDRGRASLAPVGRIDSAGVDHSVAAPAQVALEYALVADTLLAWTVAGPRVEVFRAAVDTVRLVRTIEHLRQQLEKPGGEAELRPGLSQLYEWLIRPVESRLGGAGNPVVIITDGHLAAIPFAALYDARRKRYLVEKHPLRFAVSLREARRQTRRPRVSESALFVSDPAFDPAEHAQFARLKEAAHEVREIASGYPRSRVLSGEEAHGAAFRAALGWAGMVHYAGHAVFEDERPEHSYLLLAPTPGRAGVATLAASEIAQMDLRHLSLVVLAACQTVRTGPGRAAGFSGLAGAFLAAGAGGVVGSLWEVDDRLARSLMIEFHRAYRSSRNGAGALREAQLRLLRSDDATLRSPSAWAGFRYVGS